MMVESQPQMARGTVEDVFYCRGLKQPLKELWPQLKHWD